MKLREGRAIGPGTIDLPTPNEDADEATSTKRGNHPPRGAWLRFLGLALRAPRRVLAVAALVTLGLGLHAPGLRVDGSIESLLVSGDPERAYHEEIERVFGSDEMTRIGIFADDVFAPETLGRIDRLSRSLARLEGVREVTDLTTISGVEMTDEGLRPGRLLRAIPKSDAEAAAFRVKVLGNPLYVGSVVSLDGRSTAVTVLYEPMSDALFEARNIEGRVRAAVADFGGPEETAISGIPTLKVHGSRQMEQDIRRFSVIAMVLVVFVLAGMFRSARGVVLPLVAVGMGVVWTNGLMALLGQPVTIGTLVLNPLLMAIGVAYAIHVLSRYFLELETERPHVEVVSDTLEHVGLPVALAALTTLVGFATLIPHPITTIRDLGLYSVFGIAVIFVASLTVIPSILVLLPAARPDGDRPQGRRLVDFLRPLARFTVAQPGLVISLSAALCAVSILGVSKLRIETDYLGFFDRESTVRRDSERIARHLAGAHPLYVVVEGEGSRPLLRPDALRGMRRLQRFLDGQAGVDKSVSVLDFLELAREAIEPGQGKTLPQRHEEAEQILLMVNPADVRHVIQRDASRANVFLYTSLSGSAEVRSFVERVERFARESLPADLRVHLTGTVVLLNRTSDTIARQQVGGLANMIAVLFVIMAVLFRSIRIGLLALVPNVFPILLLFGLMGGFGVSLNVSTSMIAVIALGIAVDDTIHYLTAHARELRQTGDPAEAVRRAMRAVGQPIVFTSIALAGGFLVGVQSGFEPIRHFGALSAVTMLIALFADLVLTPAIAMRMRIAAVEPGNPHHQGVAGAVESRKDRGLKRSGGSYG